MTRYPVWPLPEMVLLGARIRNGRLVAGASQRWVADHAGTSQAAMSRLERGLATGMKVERLVRIAETIGPSFPFGFCPHHSNCVWPADPRQKLMRVAVTDD